MARRSLGTAAKGLWNLAQDGATATACVDGCLTLQFALAEFGIESDIEAVALQINGSRPGAVYGQAPRYNSDGTFNGHTILVIPEVGRFVDPTIQ